MSDDTPSHVRVSHLYDELLFYFAKSKRRQLQLLLATPMMDIADYGHKTPENGVARPKRPRPDRTRSSANAQGPREHISWNRVKCSTNLRRIAFEKAYDLPLLPFDRPHTIPVQRMWAERDRSGKRSGAGRKLSERERSGERVCKKTMERERSEERGCHGTGTERWAD